MTDVLSRVDKHTYGHTECHGMTEAKTGVTVVLVLGHQEWLPNYPRLERDEEAFLPRAVERSTALPTP